MKTRPRKRFQRGGAETQKGEEDHLLEIDEKRGQVLDMEEGLLFPPDSMGTLTSQVGPWYDYTGPQERLAELLAQVEPAPPIERPPHPQQTREEKLKLIEELRAKRKAQQ